ARASRRSSRSSPRRGRGSRSFGRATRRSPAASTGCWKASARSDPPRHERPARGPRPGPGSARRGGEGARGRPLAAAPVADRPRRAGLPGQARSRTRRPARPARRSRSRRLPARAVHGRRRPRSRRGGRSPCRPARRPRRRLDRRARASARRAGRAHARRASLPRAPGAAGAVPAAARRRMKVLLVTMYFPPAGGGGVQRPLKFATHLPELGIETHVLAPDDPKWIHRDEELEPPSLAWVHRVRYVGPVGRKPAEELHGTAGLQRIRRQAALLGRRLLVPDENVSWNVTAIPAAFRIVRREGIDVVLTTSPPSSVHLVGAAVKRTTGARWLADLRDSLVAHPHRRAERLAVRAKEQTEHVVARLVARQADAIVTVSEAIAEEMRSRSPRGPVVQIANGADFDDFAGLSYRRGDRFRITHAGSFFGKRDPRPFLTALARVDGVVARFVGDFRAADREWADGLGLGERLELVPYVPRRRSLALQRDSEAL